jgi:hypothetical protein
MQTTLRHLLSAALLLSGTLSATAQTAVRCGTAAISSLSAEDLAAKEKVERQTQEYIRQLAVQTAARAQPGNSNSSPQAGPIAPSYTIPVVVHVLHNPSNPASYISVSQVLSQLEVLNEDFARTNTNWNPSVPYASAAAVSPIKFKLATIDPKGACHDSNPDATGIKQRGINYRSTPNTSFPAGSLSIQNTSGGGLDAWDTKNYLNIWVCDLDPITNGIVGGYIHAGYPSERPDPRYDGIVMNYRVFGRTASAIDEGHSLTHEVGHYFNLLHIFGPGNGGSYTGCEDDRVSDTTPIQGVYTGSAYFVGYMDCNPHYSDCANTGTPVLDMYNNHMAYTPGTCRNMFTTGQVNRMVALLQPNGLRYLLARNSRAFNPQPIVAPLPVIPTSYCGATQATFEMLPPAACQPNAWTPAPTLLSYTYVIDPVDATTTFASNGSQSTLTSVNPSVTINMATGEYVKNVFITANFSDGTTSPATIQPLRMHMEKPGNIPSGLVFLQEKDNSCYYSVSIPVAEGADRYNVVVWNTSRSTSLGNVQKAIPASVAYAAPGATVNCLVSVPGGLTNRAVLVDVTATNSCGVASTVTFNATLPAAPAGCLNQTTNRAAALSPAQETPAVALYPNPAAQEVTISSALAAGVTNGQIRNQMGRVVKTFRVDAENPTIRLDELPAGLYIVELEGKSKMERHQLSIEHR